MSHNPTIKAPQNVFDAEIKQIIKNAKYIYWAVALSLVGKIMNEVMDDLGWEKSNADIDHLNMIHLLWFSGNTVSQS